MTEPTEKTITADPLELESVVSPGQPQGGTAQSGGAASANTSSGSVQAFREIRRELTVAELSNSGVHKLILDRLDGALALSERLSSFETRFHEKDKQVDILQEKLKKRVGLDLAWGAGVSIGLALVTLAPAVWNVQPSWIGTVFLAIGVLLIAGGIAIRVLLQ